jgi:hypothetical protein
MNGNEWTKEQVKSLIRLWHLGLKAETIAERLGPDITAQAVRNKAARLVLPARHHDWGPWRPEVEQYLRDRWAEGWSGGKIAEGILQQWQIKLTRSAVIGKAHRMRLGPHANSRPGGMSGVRKMQRKGQRNVSAVWKPVGKPLAAFKVEPLPMPQGEPDRTSWVPLSELETHSCRWVWGDPAEDHGYCGRECVPGKSYCAGHLQRAYLPVTTLKRRKDWDSDTQIKIRELQRIIAD